jgi:hypothetical protein
MKESVLLLIGIFVALVTADAIDDLKVGEWYAVPNSRIDAVQPDPIPPCYGGGACGSIRGLIDAWNSGAFDTKRGRLLVWGGGHCDYGGNEIYAFDVNTLKWSRVWGPTPTQYIPPCYSTTGLDTYGDGNPAPRHTYDGLEYIPDPIDGLLIVGGPSWGSSGGGGTWIFKFGTGAWEKKQTEPDGRNGDESAYDPITGHLFMRGRRYICEFDPVNNQWTSKCNCSNGGWYSDGTTGAIDPKRRLMVFAGEGEWGVYNITTNQFSQPSTSGDNGGMISASAPGLDYDPVSDKMVAWKGGTDIYSLDLDNWQWTRHAAAATNTVTPTAPSGSGTYGRFRYVPSKNVFIVVNGVDENVFIYRLTTGSGVTASSPGHGVSGPEIIVSPNPFSSKVRIEFSNRLSEADVSLFDITGRHIKTFGKVKSGQVCWNAQGLSKGIYILKIKLGTSIHTKTLLLQ